MPTVACRVPGKHLRGGIRVPTIIRWPAKITGDSKLKVGSSTDGVDCSDWLPTFCELAGYPSLSALTAFPCPGVDGQGRSASS